jgi:hypothetical protein
MSCRTGPLRAARPLRGVYTLFWLMKALALPLVGSKDPRSLHIALSYIGGGCGGVGFVEVLLDDFF